LKKTEFRWIPVLITVLLATLLWFVTFALSWSTFWIKISVSSASLAALSLWLQRQQKPRFRWDKATILLGLTSAALLYLIFVMGKIISMHFFSFAENQIGGIYGKGEGTRLWVIAMLLFFVTGPSEELYWRGYLQRQLMLRLGGFQGWILATAVYAGVHIWSLNVVLIGAAGVAGAFWGVMYWRLGNLTPVIISHSLWSAVIFTVAPLS
jgi:membrane protease YdiL (CAAX protease family)